MNKVLKSVETVFLGIALGIFLIGVAMILNGCQMARGPGGEIIVGVPVGTLVETAEQAAFGAVGMIPGVGGLIQSFLAPAFAGGLTVAGSAKAARMALEKRRKKADMAREAAEKRIAELEAEKAAKEA